ncbi:DUF4132 domain-containing protein [Streptomyces fuscichromogenes]|uniref:DUF4132 domain-containing protein n=1 Tax=Streptomyces fuscichromogenes TaxID=1324013 RepID=A0A917XC86_9ACTN|nr:DUF4132 domain-containing protein [Streptomyces fuscichromogenes]GGN07194.1 hypothetical protein GCM10011578_031670 [Streptomyces fuscichromogenes]
MELPSRLGKWVVPRRGDAIDPPVLGVRAVVKALKTYQGMVTAVGNAVENALAHPKSDPDLVAAVRDADLADLDRVTPAAAAVTLAYFLVSHPMEKRAYSTAVIDAWVGARGVAFAAEALVTSMHISPGDESGDPYLHRDQDDRCRPEDCFGLAARTREHLAAASDADHAAAMAVVAPLRDGFWARSMLTSFLFPERRDWVDEDIQTYKSLSRERSWHPWLAAELLLGCVNSAEQVEVITSRALWSGICREPRRLANLWASLGPNALTVFHDWIRGRHNTSDERRKLYGYVAMIPTDEAFLELLAHIDERHVPQALDDAAQRFPRRALRLLAESSPDEDARGQAVARVLRLLTLSNREIAEDLLPILSTPARARVASLLTEASPVAEAAPQTLPALLVAPPWTTDRQAAEEVVIADLTAPVQSEVEWLPGERERFAGATRWPWGDLDKKMEWETVARQIADGTVEDWCDPLRFLLKGPEELVRPMLPSIKPYGFGRYVLPGTVARFGADAAPPALRAANESPVEYGKYLMPLASSEVATLMSDWFVRLRSCRRIAREWLRRHPALAARTLIPVALGEPGAARTGARSVLWMLVLSGFADVVAEAAASYGEPAAKAVADLIADGVHVLPKTMPDLSAWAEPDMLPRLLLKGRQAALPAASARFVVQMLTVSLPDAPYAGLAVVEELCDARSLAEFGWALFENWRAFDCPPNETYALDALGWLGDDETVRRLAPVVLGWVKENVHKRAAAGLDVLGAFRGDTALIELHGIAQRVQSPDFKEKMAIRIQAIADEMGLSAEQLDDRLVLDLGLDADGSLTLDYGPRRFRVGFDEQLKPYVADETGKRLRFLPKPGEQDDRGVAEAAYERFSRLKKEARILASDQIARFESALCVRRTWNPQDFRQYLVGHPLLRHLVRRLVWTTFDPDGTPGTAFRVTEDLSFADVADGPFALPDDTSVGLAHPLDLGGDLAAWSEVFADHRILQPFPQLGRPVFTLTDEERDSVVLTRFTGITVPPLKLLGMERHGWYPGSRADAGGRNHLLRDLPGGRVLVAGLNPGLYAGSIADSPEQTFDAVYITEHEYRTDPHQNGLTFSELDCVTASELLRDLTEVTSV